MTEEKKNRLCKQCEKPLLGRSDQVFCNDSCRNTFNKQKARKEKIPSHPNRKAIFNIIQQNYEILMKLPPNGIHPGHSISFSATKVHHKFNRNFFTSILQDKDGFWKICFDRGWRDDGDAIYLKDFPEKSWIREEDQKLNR